MHIDLNSGFRHAAPACGLRHTQSVDLHALDRLPHLARKLVQKPPQVVCAFRTDMIVLRKEFRCILDWRVQGLRAGRTQMVDNYTPIAYDRRAGPGLANRGCNGTLCARRSYRCGKRIRPAAASGPASEQDAGGDPVREDRRIECGGGRKPVRHVEIRC